MAKNKQSFDHLVVQERDAVRDVACSYCSARLGQLCKTNTGKRLSRPHVSRVGEVLAELKGGGSVGDFPAGAYGTSRRH